MYLVGPTLAKLLFHAFVVLVDVLILSGAANNRHPRRQWRAHPVFSGSRRER